LLCFKDDDDDGGDDGGGGLAIPIGGSMVRPLQVPQQDLLATSSL